MKVSEIFFSIQGEGVLMGTPTIFIRFSGCNLDCAWCDTDYAKNDADAKEMSINEILDEIERYDSPFISITGGEPMIQEGIINLINALLEESYHITIETNGSIPLDSIPTSEEIMISMDMKCPSSGMTKPEMYDNLSFLSPRDQLKFVIADRVDYLFAKKVLRENDVNCPAIMTPVGGMDLKPLAEWVIQDCLMVRVMPQLHKLIWGNAKGV